MTVDDFLRFKHFVLGFDGVLMHTKSGAKYRQNAQDWKWYANRLGVIRNLKGMGKVISFVSNQAGVAFDWSSFTEEEIEAELKQSAQEIPADFVAICYTTPNPNARSEYYDPNDKRRKPGPDMIKEALNATSQTIPETLMVGFLPEDEMAAKAAGITYVTTTEFFEAFYEG